MLKDKLTSALIRVYSNFNKPFKLYMNVSDMGLGAVLAQDNEQERKRVIAYDVRRLNQAKQNYLTIEKECLTVVWAIQKFKQYLGGWIPFTVFTNHTILKTMNTYHLKGQGE